MAGEIERFISPSIAFEVKPAQNIQYHDKLISSKSSLSIMENYLSNEIDEDVLVNFLLSDDKRSKALQHLDEHLQENNGTLLFQDKRSLFRGFLHALADSNPKVAMQCTKVILKIIPQLGPDLDKHMSKILPLIIGNVGNQSVTLQKESIQTLYVYMKHSQDVFLILRAIARDGIQHKNARIRQQIVRSFPTLLFAEFKGEDFFDIVHSLVGNLTENLIDHEVILHILDKVSDFIGKDVFTGYINRLSSPLRHTYNKYCTTSNVEKLIDLKAPNRAAIHAKHLDAIQHDDFTRKSTLFDGTIAEVQVGNFANSGYFDSTSPRRRPHGNMYSSLSTTLPRYDKSSSLAEKIMPGTGEHYSNIPFIPRHIVEQLSSPEHSIRLQAVEALRDVLYQTKDTALLKKHMFTLLSLLNSVFDDKNFRVVCGAVRAFSAIVSNMGSELNGWLKLFVYAVARKLGNAKDSVRSECYKVLFQLMDAVGRQKVLDLFWEKLVHKQYKVREDFVCVIIATLLTSLKSKNNYDDINFEVICNHIAPLLTDSQQAVRKAALDCIAVLGYILGTTSKTLLSAVDSVELKHDNASGVMSAVHARLLRKQLPRLNDNMLVEYAIFPPSTAPVTSPQGADIHWILAAEKPKKGSPKRLYPALDKEPPIPFSDDAIKSIENFAPASSILQQPRRHFSAGKHRQFPWTSQDDQSNSKHPSSAPVIGGKTVKNHPPFRPRNTWGPESEMSSQKTKSTTSTGYEPTIDNGPSYQELYKRRKEAHGANVQKPPISSAFSSHNSHRSDSGYKPSFASNGFSASSSSSNTQSKSQSSHAEGSTALSSSCPSTFFENNSSGRPVLRRNKKPIVAQSDDVSVSSGYGSKESDSPFKMKPQLARSASKRRDHAVAASRELLKAEDANEKVPLKLKNTSASPRFDRIVSNISVEQVRPMFKPQQHNTSATGTEKFPGPVFDHHSDNSGNDDITIGGYTPSTPQRKLFKDSIDHDQNAAKSVSAFEAESTLAKHEPLPNGNNDSNKPSHDAKAKSYPAAKPIIPSKSSPARHRGSEDAAAEFQSNAVSSIRRSAQNKRERMRSQPVSEDSGFNNSFSEFSNDTISVKLSSSAQSDARSSVRSSSQPVAQADVISTSSVEMEAPSFKYSPNTGVTFVEPKKVDMDVSVIGTRYLPNAMTDNVSSQSTPVPAISSISSSSLHGNKYSTSGGHERHRASLKGSSLGSGGNTTSPDFTNCSFNVQGKGVFMTSSNTSLQSASEINDFSPVSSKEGMRSKSSPNDLNDPSKFIDGVCGVAVRQSSLTPDDLQSHRANEVSLSASLKERKLKQKEGILKHTPKPRPTYDADIINKLKINPTEDYSEWSENHSREYSFENTKKSSKVAASRPLKASGSSKRGIADLSASMSKPGSGGFSNILLPLDNPEKSLLDAITALEIAGSEDWEVVTQGMYTIRRLATHHTNTLANRFHDVIVLLTKHVRSLRSQVSKASVQAVTDLYVHLKKPVVDSDIETTVQALLAEHGKPNSFIRQEASKTLQAIVAAATTNKILNALLSAGLRHKSNGIRDTTARFCFELVDKMGPGKALSGVKDITDRLLDAVAVFINDRSPDVRYYGRCIISKLMVHEDFNKSLERYLSAENAQVVRNAASSVQQRGLGGSSVGGRKISGSTKKRNGGGSAHADSSATMEWASPSSSSQSRRKGTVTKVFNEQEQEELRNLCHDLGNGSFIERKAAIALLRTKLYTDRQFVEENVVKIMASYVLTLQTAQTKVNSIGLESLPELIKELHPCLKDFAPQLIPALLKLVSSKQHSDMALHNIDVVVKYMEHAWIIKPFATSAMFGTAKAKQIAIVNLIKLLDRVVRKNPQIVERQVLPVLWNLISSTSTPSNVQLRKETVQLTRALYNVYGLRLYELAEAQNYMAKVKEILESQNL